MHHYKESPLSNTSLLTATGGEMALYVHWPFCKAKCPYCDFNSHVREGVEHGVWRESLLSELRWTADMLPGRRLTSIFFGGGTPSLMEPATVEAVIDSATRYWPATDNIEITLEANPTSVEAGKLAAFKTAGVNRVSLGVQSLQAADLKFLGRQHDAREALAAVELAGNLFDRMSFDLIYARPGQTVAAWESELRHALRYAKDHLSLYQLTIEENTAFHHAYHVKREFVLPEDDNAANLYEVTQAVMEEAGMPAYEVSNHAKPGSESRHNLAYWQGLEYAGIGPGAHGRIHPQGMRTATQTIKSPELWLEAVKKNTHGMSIMEAVSPPVLIEELLMMGLRISNGVDAARFYQQTGRVLDDCINRSAAAQLVADGLITHDKEGIRPTIRGFLLLNYVTSALIKE